MVVLALIISFLVGLTLILSISAKFSTLEYATMSFPIGLGFQSILMSILDLLNIGIHASGTLIASLLCMIVLGYFAYKNIQNTPEFIQSFNLKQFKLPKPNYTWLLFFGLLVWFEGMNFYKTTFLPTFDTDSIRGFDFVARTISIEGTLKQLSLFTDPNLSFQGDAGLASYTPMVQLSYAYVYLFGATSSKIVSALLYLCFLGMFYSALKRVTTHTAAAIATFLMMITPEMLAFSALSGINVIHASYASIGLIYATLWFKNKRMDFLLVSSILLALNCFARNEGIVFSGMAFLLVAYKMFKKEVSWKTTLLFFLISFFGFIYWNISLKINNIHSGSNLIILKPYWDADKASTIFEELKVLYGNTLYYGIGIYLFGIMLVINLWNIIKKADQLPLIASIFGVILFYTILIYQIDYVWDTIENVLRYSYKRFLFSFIPLMWFYIATNHNVLWSTKKLDQLLYK